ncbi:caspase family protein [Neolewinella persica]|uniref:caspase family protein n=1 Tax=Neolewinella persica TaxID=70998 RepID=UPI0003A240C3|nr:caspase family protein [Neolewinella persica]
MTLFAFLVSVSDYPPGISSLPGCRHDLKNMQDFLGEYSRINSVKMAPFVLKDENATRKKVIEGFKHFKKAKADDICLFYYTGHGAQMVAPPEFWRDEPSRMCQTLVLHDSRLPGGRDLVDKEISYLLATHAKDAGQLLMIADSCHSGTISRLATATPRTTAAAVGMRYDELEGSEHYLKDGAYRIPLHRDHITLSACLAQQVAIEMPIGGVPRGLFTYYLIETMNGSRLSELSYAELMDRVRVRVKNHYQNQDVHAMATGDSDLDQLFLGGKLKRDRAYLLHRGKDDKWFFNQGAVQGITVGMSGKVLVGKEEKVFTVDQVLAGRATIKKVDWMLPGATDYPVVEMDKEEPQLAVFFSPSLDDYTLGNLLEEIKEVGFQLEVVTNKQQAKYHVTVLKNYGLSLVLPEEERPLFSSETADTVGWEERFINRLAKVARYEATLSLAPTEQVLPLAQAVDVSFEQVYFNSSGEEVKAVTMQTDGSAVFEYTEIIHGEQLPPRLRLRVAIKSGYRGSLYVGALLMDESFGVSANYMAVKEITFSDPSHTISLSGEKTDGTKYYYDYLPIAIDQTLREWGLTEIQNYFKVIVSETTFDMAGHVQEPLDAQRKFDPMQGRKVVMPGPTAQRRDRWASLNIPFRVRQTVVIPSLGAAGDSVTIVSAPSGFSCEMMRLHSSLSITRTLHPAAAPTCPTEGYGLEPASIYQSRGTAPPVDVLELENVTHASAVSDMHPLEIKAEKLANDGCLALAYDKAAGRYYPVGYPDAERGMIIIRQLPEPEVSPRSDSMINEKSLSGSVKLFFRKVVGDYLPGVTATVNQLRTVQITEDLRVVYEDKAPSEIVEDVTNCTKPIALFIHGIIGDTSLAPSILGRAKQASDQPIQNLYGLVLTYDYENLNTELTKTAEDLQEQLQKVGLKPGHGKTLHVYAHSMGGLVSRYFIEMLRGHEVVSHLVQFGTPNGGSPYGNVAQWITPLLTYGLGAGAAYHPLFKPLLGLRWLAPKLLITLQQMKTGSIFLKDLTEKGDRRDVRYIVINGDIRLIPETGESDAAFLARVFGNFGWREAVDLVFFREPTDIAVSVNSQREIPLLTSVAPPVGCDHLSYFTNPASIAGLEGYLSDIFPE